MTNVFKILEEIGNTSSRNEKKNILRFNYTNQDLRDILIYTYTPRWRYGIGTKSIKSFKKLQEIKTAQQENKPKQNFLFDTKTTVKEYTNIFQILDELKLHPYGSQSDINLVNNFLAKQDEFHYNWYVKVITKDLNIGCTAKTINEVFEDLIPIFEVMLAYPYEDHIKKVDGKVEFQIQEKLNGYRFITYLHPDGSTQFFTRNGLELFNFPDIERAFASLPKLFDGILVFDGEAQASYSFNETQKYMMRDGEKIGIRYNLFDMLVFEEWEHKESVANLFQRYDLLKSCIPSNSHHLKVVEELYRGNDITEVTKWFNVAKQKKWEGIMLKFNTPYVRKRTADMLKVKEMKEIDLKCIAVNIGKPDGRFKDTLGSITVDYNGVRVDVSGFTDYERNWYWTNPDEIVGRTVTVQYFEETTNEIGEPSLQFPVFIGVRTDK